MENYFTINNLLSKEECDTIIKYSIDNFQLKEAMISDNDGIPKKDELSRKSSIVSIDIDDKFPFVKQRILKELPNYIKVKGYNINFENTFYQFTEYKEGEFYNWHTDSTEEGPLSERYCSIVIQLNDDYSGGELQLKDDNTDIITFQKGIGNLFVFLSSILHKVEPVVNGTRYSLVNWFSLTPDTNFKKTLL
jgi:PKHD-type hydroxylase